MIRSQTRGSRKAACALLAVMCLVATACGSSKKDDASSSGRAREKVSWWVFWTGSEYDAARSVADDFEKTHPGIKVDVVAGAGGDTTQILPAVAAGRPPDLAGMWNLGGIVKLCNGGQLEHLAPRMAADNITTKQYSTTAQATMAEEIHDCGLPLLGHSVGLYYNKALFEQANIDGPPKTLTELAEYARKLTTYNPDGSISVAGFVPMFENFYSNYTTWFGAIIGARWLDASGKANIARDPLWARLFRWQRDLVDSIGAEKLTRYAAAAGNNFTAQNAFETGKLAMMLDGEWRSAFIAREHPELSYSRVPFPVFEDQSARYGASFTTPDFLIIPKGAKHPDAAWQLAKYLSTDVGAAVKLANGLHNIPQYNAAASSPDLDLGPDSGAFLAALTNPNSGHAPALAVLKYEEPVKNFVEKWQTGAIPVADLQSSLAAVDRQIDTIIKAG